MDKKFDEYHHMDVLNDEYLSQRDYSKIDVGFNIIDFDQR